MKIDDILAKASVIPVVEIDALAKVAPLAAALAEGGLEVVELTLRTSCAVDALVAMKRETPSLIVGMGTVRGPADVNASVEAGADFLVSPGASVSLLDALAKSGVPALPGVATASEAMTAQDAGFGAVKFFPAEPAGGVAYLKSLAGPLPDLVFCPTGGIDAGKAKDYLALANVACVGGSWIATKDMIAREDWAAVRANAAKAAALKK